MRLTCPNCGAQYEVPDDIIPTAGRDVQCSSCGNTWFQTHPDHPLEAEAEPEDTAAQEVEEETASASPQDETEPEPFEEVEPPELSIAPESDAPPHDAVSHNEQDVDPDDLDLGGTDWDLETEEAWAEPERNEKTAEPAETEDDDEFYEDLEEEVTDESGAEDPAWQDQAADSEEHAPDQEDTSAHGEEQSQEPPPERVRRGIDDSVADILREEAAYEFQARAAEEPQSLETQGDLGLDDAAAENPVDDTDPVAARVNRLRGEEKPKLRKAAVANPHATRRDLLPDIEEINSTLRSTEMPKRKADPRKAIDVRARRGKGFRLGFCVVLLIAAAAIFVYSSHASLSQRYPEAAPYIESFMASANGTRIWLDDKVTQLFLKLNDMTG